MDAPLCLAAASPLPRVREGGGKERNCGNYGCRRGRVLALALQVVRPYHVSARRPAGRRAPSGGASDRTPHVHPFLLRRIDPARTSPFIPPKSRRCPPPG